MRYFYYAANKSYYFLEEGQSDEVVPPEYIEVTEAEMQQIIQENQAIAQEGINRNNLYTVRQRASEQKSAMEYRMSVINDAIAMDGGTPEEAAELADIQAKIEPWKEYAVLLGRVNADQPDWYHPEDWPEPPVDRIDSTVNPLGRA